MFTETILASNYPSGSLSTLAITQTQAFNHMVPEAYYIGQAVLNRNEINFGCFQTTHPNKDYTDYLGKPG